MTGILTILRLSSRRGGTHIARIFDNGAGLLSNTQLPMDIDPKALIAALRARPFNTTFTRQMNAARSLTGKQLFMPKLTVEDIHAAVHPLLEYHILFATAALSRIASPPAS